MLSELCVTFIGFGRNRLVQFITGELVIALILKLDQSKLKNLPQVGGLREILLL